MAELSKAGFKKADPLAGNVWDPETEKEIQGVLMKKETDIGPNHSTMYTLEDKDGEIVKVWANAVLESRMDLAQIGQEVIVQYLGMVEGKNNRSYKNYDVYFRDVPFTKAEVKE